MIVSAVMIGGSKCWSINNTKMVRQGRTLPTIRLPIGDMKLNSGFGSDLYIPGLPIILDSRFSTTIEVITQCIACIYGNSVKFPVSFEIPTF